MIYYNVTTQLEKSIESKWLKWMQKNHIPEMLNTKKFIEVKLLRIIDDEKNSTTYATQYVLKSKSLLYNYLKTDGKILQNKTYKKFGDKALSFRTQLELIGYYE